MSYEIQRYVTITFEPEGRRARAVFGSTILRAALKYGVGIRTECGGVFGRCGKCRVVLKDQSNVGRVTRAEAAHLTSSEIEEGYRLACQTAVKGDVVAFLPVESRVRKREFQVSGVRRSVELDPAIKKLHLNLLPPDILDVRPDLERLFDGLKDAFGVHGLEASSELIYDLPRVVRNAGWDLTLVVWNGAKAVSVEPSDSSSRIFGVAVDVGTSKIVASLVDLQTGSVLGLGAIENPQTLHGEDVISRITFAMKSREAAQELKALVLSGVNSAVAEACEKAAISASEVYEAVVVGNTAMHHLFLGLETEFLAKAPYPPVVKSSLNITTDRVGLKIGRAGNLHLPPLIAGFVGSDYVAGILATGVYESNRMTLFMDLGTNTEISLGDGNDMLCCSCASGPAWEGGHVKHGMKAVDGAIDTVRIDPHTFEVEYTTIKGVKPVGICGSAMIDLLSEVYRCGLIDAAGRFSNRFETLRLRNSEWGKEFVVAWAGETDIGEDVTLTQRDVSELQLAKAATYTGCSILMKRMNVKPDDIEDLYVAGAFGDKLNMRSSLTIGLIPDVSLDKVKFMGNTALTGAELVLKSRRMRRETEEISRRVRYMELAADCDFNTEFASALFIPHSRRELFPSVKRYVED